jgi:hypothetical protein
MTAIEVPPSSRTFLPTATVAEMPYPLASSPLVRKRRAVARVYTDGERSSPASSKAVDSPLRPTANPTCCQRVQPLAFTNPVMIC